MSILSDRTRILREGTTDGKAVLYWMARDKRAADNWALIAAQAHAIKHNLPLIVCFQYTGNYSAANIRQYGFLFGGLEKTKHILHNHNIPFLLIKGNAEDKIPRLINKYDVGALFTDFSPLRVYRKRLEKVIAKTSIPFYQVDAHNIVPIWMASSKQEYGAYTIRPKIFSHLDNYLINFIKLKIHPFDWDQPYEIFDWDRVYKSLKIDFGVAEVDWLSPGEEAGKLVLNSFIAEKLTDYAEKRNDPNIEQASNLSPYLNFGQIAPQRVVLELKNKSISDNKDSFLEQCIIRRELSDNFCYYNHNYDSFEGFPLWAQQSHNDHRNDEREYVYHPEQFEHAATHDELWNAAQREMKIKGKMHSYMRMYWAKKILEWSPNPELALQTAIDLNDKYSLDGRDPNGYTGIAWSIGGVHDRPWFERPIYGKIRYMNYNGCRKKFNVKQYISKYI